MVSVVAFTGARFGILPANTEGLYGNAIPSLRIMKNVAHLTFMKIN